MPWVEPTGLVQSFSGFIIPGMGNRREFHPNSSHLSHCVAAIDHMPTPGVHYISKFRKISRSWILISRFILTSCGNVPEVSPLRVKGRRHGSHWGVFFCIALTKFRMVSRPLSEFWCGSNLKTIFRINIFGYLGFIEILPTFIEVLLHHI